jgi:hypothetical protein
MAFTSNNLYCSHRLSGPIAPIPLIPDSHVPGPVPQLFRLLHHPLKAAMNRSLPQWILQNKNTPDDPWLDAYTFSDQVEFFLDDYEVMSYYTSTRPDKIFLQKLICVRTILSTELESGEDFADAGLDKGKASEVTTVGRMILIDGEVKKRIGAKTTRLAHFETEDERVKALKRWFGIELTQEEREAIKGRGTEIR